MYYEGYPSECQDLNNQTLYEYTLDKLAECVCKIYLFFLVYVAQMQKNVLFSWKTNLFLFMPGEKSSPFLKINYRQLRARRVLLQFKDLQLRIRRVLLLYKVCGNSSAFLVLNGTSLKCNNALLALNWVYNLLIELHVQITQLIN